MFDVCYWLARMKQTGHEEHATFPSAPSHSVYLSPSFFLSIDYLSFFVLFFYIYSVWLMSRAGKRVGKFICGETKKKPLFFDETKRYTQGCQKNRIMIIYTRILGHFYLLLHTMTIKRLFTFSSLKVLSYAMAMNTRQIEQIDTHHRSNSPTSSRQNRLQGMVFLPCISRTNKKRERATSAKTCSSMWRDYLPRSFTWPKEKKNKFWGLPSSWQVRKRRSR